MKADGRCRKLSNTGSSISASASASTSAISAISTASPRNWMISWRRLAPSVLRNEISRARSMARAVARLMKLKQATSRISTPMATTP